MSVETFSINRFDSGSIDLTNPSEIFEIKNDDLSSGKGTFGIVGDESIHLKQNYNEFDQVNQTASGHNYF